jgi:hypothetical protein
VPGFPLSPELARAWERYFRQEGGTTPSPVAQALPVVIMDDTSHGPFPSCRHWFGGLLAAAPVNFGYYGITNRDPIGSGSVAVIDLVIPQLCDNWWVGVTGLATLPLVDTHIIVDAGLEKEPQQIQSVLGMLGFGYLDSALLLGQAEFYSGPAGVNVTPNPLPGPFMIGPQECFFWRSQTGATRAAAFVRGRYYAGF